MIVEVGYTAVEPISVLVEKESGVIVIVVDTALATFQKRVEVPPESTVAGFALNDPIVGGAVIDKPLKETSEVHHPDVILIEADA